MMERILKTILFFFIVFPLGFTNAQTDDRVKVELDKALNMAKDNNFDLMIAKEDVNSMQADLNSSLAVFLPKLTFNETFVRTNDPLNVFGLKLKQEIVSQMDFNPALLNDPDLKNNYNTRVDLVQPIINLDGFFGRAAASDGLSAMKYKYKRTEHFISFMTKVNYYKVGLMEQSLTVVNQAEETAVANRKLIKDYYDEGLITKADYLMAEVFVNKVKAQKAEVEAMFYNSSDELKHFIGLSDDRLVETENNLYSPIELSTDVNETEAINNRSDIKSYEYRKNSLSKMHSVSWMKILPRLNAFASFEYNDDEIFGTQADNWMVGVNLQWNIFDGFKNISGIQKSKAESKKAAAEYEKAVSTGKNEIRAAVRDLKTAELKVTLADKGEEQSRESLKIIKDRFKKGLEKTSDLLIAETEYSSARLEALKALFFYNVSLYKLELMIEKSLIK